MSIRRSRCFAYLPASCGSVEKCPVPDVVAEGQPLTGPQDPRNHSRRGLTDPKASNHVSPDERFRGVSRALLRAPETRAIQRGNLRCTLTSTETARRFCHANGYVEDGAAEPGTRASYSDVEASDRGDKFLSFVSIGSRGLTDGYNVRRWRRSIKRPAVSGWAVPHDMTRPQS